MDKKKKITKRIIVNILLVLIALSVLIPFVYIVLVSFGKDSFMTGSAILPNQYTLTNYILLFTKNRFSYWIFNSIAISVATMGIAVVLTTISVYALSRLRFRGREQLFSGIMMVQIFPLTLSMVSIHKIFVTLELLDKISGLVLVDSVMASASMILLARGYFSSIPYELDEAAQIDGANRIVIMKKIILPLVKPMLAIVAVQSFVLAYNEYVIANVVMTGGFKSMPLAVGLQSLIAGQYGTNWSVYCAAAVIGSVPMVIIFYSMQKYFIGGLAEGGVK